MSLIRESPRTTIARNPVFTANTSVEYEGCVEKTATRPFSHSNDHLSRVFNFTTFNIGYHIEHHDFPHVHWSELPALHERMKGQLASAGASLLPVGYYGAARLRRRRLEWLRPPVAQATRPLNNHARNDN